LRTLLITALFSILFTMGCSKHTPEERNTDHMKFDAPLRTKLAQMERDDNRSAIAFYIETDGNIDTDKRILLEETGVTIKSVVDNIAVAEGDPESIQRCTQLEFVRSMSLSVTRRPLN
jgi:hypothetical protein